MAPAGAASICENSTATPSGSPAGLVADCDALLAAKDTLRGTGTLNWSKDLAIGSWQGVTVSPSTGSNRRVARLRLQAAGLTGSIPTQLGSLGKLTMLNLSYNNLTGSIPAELGDLSELNFLILSNNKTLAGEIPAALGDLSNLYSMQLSTNSLTGSIPKELGNLRNLQTLEMQGNKLTGSLPSELQSLTNVHTLSLSDNKLTGSIPIWLGGLAELSTLELALNRLTGSIPTQLGGLAKLRQLSLTSNSLTGGIPAELGSLAELRYLELGSNGLTGGIPTQLGGLAKLTHLRLNNNSLTGGIPTELGNLAKLRYMDLSGNGLAESIPTQLGNLASLWHLNLASNSLTGGIPVELGNLSANLEELYLNDNGLTEGIPRELGNLVQLWHLNLASNELTGNIPAQFGSLGNLVTLDMNSNNLTGTIPAELGDLEYLRTLALYLNQLEGCVPDSLARFLSVPNGINPQQGGRILMTCAAVAAAERAEDQHRASEALEKVLAGLARNLLNSSSAIVGPRLSGEACEAELPSLAALAASGSLEDWFWGRGFELSLNADGADGANGKRWCAWGIGDYQDFESDSGSLQYAGYLKAAYAGLDVRLEAGKMAGLAVSRSQGRADYVETKAGRVQIRLTSVHPYFRLPLEAGEAWVVGGIGRGDAEEWREGWMPSKSDLEMRMASAGLRRPLETAAGVSLALRGEASFVQLETDTGERAIHNLTSQAHQVAAGVEFSEAEGGGPGEVFGALVGRYDGGDDIEGVGLDVEGGWRYEDPGGRLRLEARGRWLVAHTESGYDEFGATVAAHLEPGENGRGLSLKASPRWGALREGPSVLWGGEALPSAVPERDEVGLALSTEAGYGVRLPGLGGHAAWFVELDWGMERDRIGIGIRVMPDGPR